MIRVIATDIDHTLLDDRGNLPPINIEALQQAASRGIRIVLATARRRQPTDEIVQRLGVPVTKICHNGARIWDETDREISHQTIDLEVARRVAELADKHNLPFIFTIDEINLFNPRATSGTPSMSLDHTPVPSLRTAIALPPTRIVAQGMQAAQALVEALGQDQSVHLFQYSRGGEVYSAIASHPNATKENALAALCARWLVRPEEVLAIGDAEADVGMLRWAGIGVAPKGSMPQALAAANWVAPSARLGGVAVAIYRYALDG
ncbi:MAG TPA: HAD family hydrolase [Herpetosiphonaceae bacterium]|nr:HAD family hydrolase [Herpetosiphonaceae bacterium]